MKTKKVYTISTQVFSTLAGAKKKLVEYAEKGDYRKDSKIFEAVQVYEVEIVKVAKVKKMDLSKAESRPANIILNMEENTFQAKFGKLTIKNNVSYFQAGFIAALLLRGEDATQICNKLYTSVELQNLIVHYLWAYDEEKYVNQGLDRMAKYHLTNTKQS